MKKAITTTLIINAGFFRLNPVKGIYLSVMRTKAFIMVDKERRKKLALHLRHLSVGLMTNDDFEEAIMEDVSDGWTPENYYRSEKAKSDNDDPIIKPKLELCWGLYDDIRNHKLVGSDELTKDALKIIARCILFLHSDKEYEWPYFNTNNPLLRFSLKDFIILNTWASLSKQTRRTSHVVLRMDEVG